MSNNISAQELFKAGITREEFIQKYTELQKNAGTEESSIFTQEFANSIGDIFDTLNTMGAEKNDTLDADELVALQGLGDDDNTTLSEKDLKALYAKMGEELMNKYDKNTTPEKMYQKAMASGDKTSNAYMQKEESGRYFAFDLRYRKCGQKRKGACRKADLFEARA